ncbi:MULTISPECIES: hypothetical protein [Cytobacillus]|uniref:Uncharacterized protein n=1 Tax=Cytobacillus firmus TaxID=1399 RepID=A0AA46PAR9_CYTFI|nr:MULTISPECIES: hypothetical protein [Cytobacillus]MCC3645401.1 hypothetical protein [Cytobacillus oceanisediminis]MCS0651965.1 hypothetical protein [Cytobacillus firmus]UYG96706.1 hypothetical protein OD459_06650 [Cytobacillus firmus]
MKKYIFLLLTILLVFSGNVSAQPNSNSAGLTEKDFMKAVLKSDEFKEFKSSILKDASTQPKALIDEKGKQYGWTVQYEIEYNEKKISLDEKALVNFSSLLSFSFESGKELKVRLVDFSRLIEDQAFYVKDLKSEEETKIDISKDSTFTDYLTEVELKKTQLIKEAAKSNTVSSDKATVSGQLCYYCTKYEWRGGYPCSSANTESEASVSFQLEENGLNPDSVVIECYVPRHKVCVDGEWRTYCPIQ